MATEASTSFPHDVLTPLPNERPTVATLRLLKQELTANAVSVHSLRGNGLLGHYALVVDDATYNIATTNIPFIQPAHPGQQPVHPAGATNAQITEVNRQFASDKSEFTLYRNTEAALKKQIIAAVPGTYINQLKHPQLGFANVTTLTILEHLDRTYGTLTVDELATNIGRMNRQWSPNESIETLFEQIRESRLFAEATDPISDATALRAALEIVEKSGVFGDAVRDFRKQAEAAKTYDNFVIAFHLADAERRRLITAKAAGYHHSANAAVSIEAEKQPESALAATAKNQSLIATGVHYCWTHGVGFNAEHTSGSCRAPQTGHRSEATISNMLGGNNFVRRQRGEKQVYVAPPSNRNRTNNTPPNANNN